MHTRRERTSTSLVVLPARGGLKPYEKSQMRIAEFVEGIIPSGVYHPRCDRSLFHA